MISSCLTARTGSLVTPACSVKLCLFLAHMCFAVLGCVLVSRSGCIQPSPFTHMHYLVFQEGEWCSGKGQERVRLYELCP